MISALENQFATLEFACRAAMSAGDVAPGRGNLSDPDRRGASALGGRCAKGRAEDAYDSGHAPSRHGVFRCAYENAKRVKRIIVIFRWTDSAIFVN